MYNKLLERQLQRHINNKEGISEEWKRLLDAVNQSYEHYEQDHLLSQKSLEISSQELRQYVDDVRKQIERTRSIIEAASDAIIVVDDKNIITTYNSVAKKILKLDDQNPHDFDISTIQVKLHDPLKVNYLEVLSLSKLLSRSKKFTLYEISIIFPDGSTIPLEISISNFSSELEKLKVCILRDISFRKRLEQKVKVRTLVTHILFESNTLEQAVPQLVSTIASLLGWDFGCFWLFDAVSEKGSLLHIFPPGPNDVETKKLINIYKEMEVVLEKERKDYAQPADPLFYSNNLQEISIERVKEAFQHGMRSYLQVPILCENASFGLMEFYSREKLEKDEQLIRVYFEIGSEIGMFIEQQQAARREMELQKKLVDAARESGMMQIATSVLHNVGNILNTLNTSTSLLHDKLQHSELNNLPKVSELIQSHLSNLSAFLTEDPKGKLLPEYLISLAKWWMEEREKSLQEFDKLMQSIDHIKKIIHSQQRFSGISGYKEKVAVNDLIDDLITLKGKECVQHQIQIHKMYGNIPLIEVDRIKLLQILLNLFCNAIDSVNLQKPDAKQITFKTEVCERNNVHIHVIDNGKGIDPVNEVKIFSYGFTTKKDGHGFGLHSSSILADEMKGNLKINNLGLNIGAEFILTLPTQDS